MSNKDKVIIDNNSSAVLYLLITGYEFTFWKFDLFKSILNTKARIGNNSTS